MEANSRAIPEQDKPETVNLLEGRKFAGELRGMADRPFLNSQRYSDQQGRALRVGADVDIVEFERRLVGRFKKLGVPLFAHCVRRSGTEQDSLYVRGLSKAKAGESPHNHGCAVDVVHGTKAWDLTRQQWEIIAHVADEVARAMGVQIRWGGDWDGDRSTTRDQWDPAHFEIQNWKERISCEHDFVRYQRDAEGVMQKHTTERCLKCRFRGFYH
ncbi:M15 family metallopeptidase [Agrobacterium pusense]|uniref:M15 family metallopeptidase n=1 Tax=Agrobacterium pusense TaxID=648995 RepID=UPI0028B01DC7|nr:M15 family metallopeptidase [Agrobacterium pusense]